MRGKRRRILLAAAASSLIILAACARPPRAPEEIAPFRQVGEASWYGPDFHGKVTASGERYNMLLMTAAHPTLPFNTLVRVTNLQNGRTAVVRINDRGPFAKGRILDLSYSAARALGANTPGVISVRIEVVGRAEAPARSPKESAARGKQGGG